MEDIVEDLQIMVIKNLELLWAIEKVVCISRGGSNTITYWVIILKGQQEEELKSYKLLIIQITRLKQFKIGFLHLHHYEASKSL